jgi:nucleoid-associated protein Lsr2
MMDEIDGSQADETVRFGLDGEAFELNLSKAHAEELRRSLEPYLKTARKTGSTRNGRHFGSAAIDKDQAGRSRLGQATRHEGIG